MRIGHLIVIAALLAPPVNSALAQSSSPEIGERYAAYSEIALRYPQTAPDAVAKPLPPTVIEQPLPTNPTTNNSDEPSYAELADRLIALESKVATQPTGIQQASFLVPSESQVDCGSFCSDSEYTVGNWYAGVDLTLLQPSYSSAAFSIDDDTGGVGPRLFVGRESFRGFGWRTRFWWLDVDSDALLDASPPIPFTLNLQASRFDLDFYRRFSSPNGSLLFGAGITGAGLRFKFDEILAVTEEGGGVSVFAEGRHQFYHSSDVSWSFLSRGRWSYIVGEWEDASPTALPRGDSNLNIAEAGLALEYTRKFDSWSLIGSYGMEVQAWDTTYFDKTSFLGSTLSMAATW